VAGRSTDRRLLGGVLSTAPQSVEKVRRTPFYTAPTTCQARIAAISGATPRMERNTLSIAGRAINTMIAASGYNDVLRMYYTTQHDGIGFNLAYIGTYCTQKAPEPFDQGYMRALFDYGYQRALRGYDWSKAPPA
jgi:hypothetical protein